MRRARMRELEGRTREQHEEVASPVSSVLPPPPMPEHAVQTTRFGEDINLTDILLTPEASKSSVKDVDEVPETAWLTVTDCSKKPDAAAVENTTCLEVTGNRNLLDLETPDIVPDKVTAALYTPDSVLAIQNSVGSVTAGDGTPVEEVVVDKWWLKKRAANTGNAGGRTGFGLERRKNSLLQNRSKVSLMR